MTHLQTIISKYEEKFDEKFPSARHTSDIYPRAELKSFLRTFAHDLIAQLQVAERERVREIVEKYFEGLIFVPNPQATKENLLQKLK